MRGMDVTTSPILLRCANAKAGTKRRDFHGDSLLLDHGERVSAAAVGQSVYSLAFGNFFWRRHARAREPGIFRIDVARTKANDGFSCLDGRTPASPEGGGAAVVV